MSTRSSTETAPRPTETDRQAMARALELARSAVGQAHPNPLVGAVLVKHGVTVGEGVHFYEKRDHAEVAALRQAGEKAWGATAYVTLEPCCTTGRTGPCTAALISAKVKQVYAAMEDPNPAVAGRGLAELRRAGIAVHAGLLEAQARALNEDYAKWIRTGLPFVTLKAAMTLDGQIAERATESTPITGEKARAAVQRMRHRADALLTGIGTVLADDPLLSDRSGEPRRRRLLRVVLDSKLRLPAKSKLVRSGQGDILVYTAQPADAPRARALARLGVEVVTLPSRGERVDLTAAIRDLGERQIVHLLMEAGAEVNGAALAGELVDKVAILVAPKFIGAGGVPLAQATAKQLAHLPALRDVAVESYEPDLLIEGYFHDVYGNRRTRRKN